MLCSDVSHVLVELFEILLVDSFQASQTAVLRLSNGHLWIAPQKPCYPVRTCALLHSVESVWYVLAFGEFERQRSELV